MVKKVIGLALLGGLSLIGIASCDSNADFNVSGYTFSKTEDKKEVAKALSFLYAANNENTNDIYAVGVKSKSSTQLQFSQTGILFNTNNTSNYDFKFSFGSNTFTDYSNDLTKENELKAIEEINNNIKFELSFDETASGGMKYNEKLFNEAVAEGLVPESYRDHYKTMNKTIPSTKAMGTMLLEDEYFYTYSNFGGEESYFRTKAFNDLAAINATKTLVDNKNKSNDALLKNGIDFSNYTKESILDEENEFFQSNTYNQVLDLVDDLNVKITGSTNNSVTLKMSLSGLMYDKMIENILATNNFLNALNNTSTSSLYSSYDIDPNTVFGTCEITYSGDSLLLSKVILNVNKYDVLLSTLTRNLDVKFDKAILKANITYSYNDKVKFNLKKKSNVEYLELI